MKGADRYTNINIRFSTTDAWQKGFIQGNDFSLFQNAPRNKCALAHSAHPFETPPYQRFMRKGIGKGLLTLGGVSLVSNTHTVDCHYTDLE
ncbi:hypothetical protein PSYPI_03142 [Pseudomonas syringae pv. pisi str. 1704B]|uniref:Uncharacterized protein n=1 Tax=Pseudomonas syringae pv. pisi str. 1704B TaxID=629263 RepID=F3G316_PSESJ|nr:hypothetical protein PSYPI_03142 [Pseudomonas syringae pv. pisi str. 1704B]